MTADRESFSFHAWVDESVHVSPGFYVLAAAVAEVEACEGHREALRGLVRAPRRRLHWKDEEDKDRLRIARTVGAMDLVHVVAVASPMDAKRQERARRKCVERLLIELDQLEVSRVWLESRGARQDQTDRAMVASMRSARAVGGVYVEFARPLDEPMLWLPDAVAGAVAAARKGRAAYREELGSALVELDVPLSK